MNKTVFFPLLFFMVSCIGLAQSVDDPFSQKRMRKDLEVFKNIRLKANSGLYKYRTKEQIDSIYTWADGAIDRANTYGDFYNIICQLTDFEGSLHNDTRLPERYNQSMKKEQNGYFPYPVKWIEGKWIINFAKGEIPLGAEIVSINTIKMSDIIKNLYKYYTTDGVNTTGKRIGITYNFSKYYRLHYGLSPVFEVAYRPHNSHEVQNATLKGIAYTDYYKNVRQRHSEPFDEVDYKDWEEGETYSYKDIDGDTGILRVNSFSLGNKQSSSHGRYLTFLDSVFTHIKTKGIKNLIVDVRYNGGGTDPNDLVTYSYLTQRNFKENKQAWISFKKLPYLKYAFTKIPRFLRPLGAGKYNKMFKNNFPEEIDGKFYQDENNEDHQIRKPRPHAFTGNIYLLIGPRVASAGSLFAAMVAGNDNTTVIGEETMGGYYGHNGHTPMGYILPKSGMAVFFSVVNLEQDVPQKSNQRYDRGIIPDYDVPQSYNDFLQNRDTQMDFTIDLIRKNKNR
ncbi:S41 family peptidase [Pseudozobellia thermophila]|uniref:Peptidase family S41 n=1 Tax=Pseudozobellia thermophila TaxID=192903 RepID=A0A1M6NUF0_9FLAO|nr:S41 family peptidase [Pseudozobellia thermophila]SHJ99301.1 Peptidase family S41 [Pseudozobellia thermophila]